MNANTVNLQEWEPFGGGGFGTSYYNKTDDSVMLKLNKPSVSEGTARQEFLRSKAVYEMGIYFTGMSCSLVSESCSVMSDSLQPHGL